MSGIYGIILAGGSGLRMGIGIPKQFLPLGGKPVIAWCLNTFASLPGIQGIVVATPPEYRERTEEIVSDLKSDKTFTVIIGGATRQGSSYNALSGRAFSADDILLFHDAARPFIREDTVLRCIEAARLHGAAGVYMRSVDTITRVREGFVESIPPREHLWQAQTPQAFRFEIIQEAHERARARGVSTASDDASLVFDAGFRVRIVEGEHTNFKITTPLDYEMARFISDTMRK